MIWLLMKASVIQALHAAVNVLRILLVILNDHVKICCPQAPLGQGTIARICSGHLYSAACFRFLLAIWCAQCHQPYKIVFDPELVQIFKMLYAKVDIPLPSTISRDIQEMYTLTKAQVAESLQV